MGIAIAIIVILLVAAVDDLPHGEPAARVDGHAVARDEVARPVAAGRRGRAGVGVHRTGGDGARTLRRNPRDGGRRPCGTTERRGRQVGTGRRGRARRHPPAVPQPRGARRHRASRPACSASGCSASCGRRAQAASAARSTPATSTTSSPRSTRSASPSTSPTQDVPAALSRRRRSANAEKVASYEPIMAGMEEGIVALYQRCVHLGCRVPWCTVVAVVRVPVPRIEVQRASARSVTGPRRAASTASRSRSTAATSSSTLASSSPVRRSAPTPRTSRRKDRRASDARGERRCADHLGERPPALPRARQHRFPRRLGRLPRLDAVLRQAR